MTLNQIAKKIKDTAESNGVWGVDRYEMPDGGRYIQFYLPDETPQGQDFYFDITINKGETFGDAVKKVEDYVNNYDPDYEASLWIEDGHGIGGAPYHIKDILKDMRYVQGLLKKLAKSLRANV